MARQGSPDSSNSPETRITITSEHGEKLVGILHDTGSKKIVILCHGLRDTKDHNTVVSIASALTRIGISSFRFDFSGNGESEGQFQFGNYWREVDDLHSVTSYLKKNYDIIAVVGHSKARFDLQKGIKERLGEGFFDRLENDKTIQLVDGKGRFEVTKDSLMDRLSINMSEEVKKIKPDSRVFTIHGSNDEVIPVEDAYEFEKVICNHKLHIIDGANHNYTLHNDKLASVVVDVITSSHL
ncbi:Alpha/beta-Hydrolases superfamily protein [Rhynchospora pubera]|uniref:Alpha/beta-Hydrolases superfamily protein n=1 Tax=Rhynchospora pubera TaxID=906938 RepID=A0AAV8E6H4_9POAL|nr:Alpha/beta-Hydrolases superfamily protein [Rhynchospora pubera]